MFFAMRWFLSYLDDFPQPAVLMQDPNDYILFFVKMMAAFGLAFQLPVVLMGMAFVGLVSLERTDQELAVGGSHRGARRPLHALQRSLLDGADVDPAPAPLRSEHSPGQDRRAHESTAQATPGLMPP